MGSSQAQLRNPALFVLWSPGNAGVGRRKNGREGKEGICYFFLVPHSSVLLSSVSPVVYFYREP